MESESLNDANIRVNAARVSLKARLAALEDRVTDTVDSARQTVTSTVNDTTMKVRSLVDATTGNVKDALDVSGCVREHPWHAAGLAMFAGVIAGVFSRGVKLPSIDLKETAKEVAATASTLVSNASPAAGWNPLRDLAEVARRELMNVGQQAITNLSRTIQHNVDSMAQTSSRKGKDCSIATGFCNPTVIIR
jgi:ElaB/YqjD/DUF883 family membrane-anchored ribosome-binding protein